MKKTKTTKISGEMTIADVLKAKPDAGAILMQHGMHCLGCSVAFSEDLKTAAQVHQIDLEKLLKALNE